MQAVWSAARRERLVTPQFAVEPLGQRHNRAAFSCGNEALDRYVKEQAGQDVRRRVARVFVAVGDDPTTIAGYYTLAATSIARESLPEPAARRLPRYPVPAAILGRLAVDVRFQHQGLGEHLVIDALARVLQASETVAVHAVVVDAKSPELKAFYERLGFRGFPGNPLRLFLPLATIARAAAGT
ncbi:MAG: GNAT family N-acetyltransferase [Chloroflexota bacterium]|nr:GNAT family N-acetyltransferase [Chloroflexota bacterium]